MNIKLEQKQCVIAGNGSLPVKMVQNAKENGFDVVAISLSNDNKKELEKYCTKVYSFGCGELLKETPKLNDDASMLKIVEEME